VMLTLVNLNQIEPRTVIIQGGAYAEHKISSVTVGDQVMEIGNSDCAVELAPGCGAQLQLTLKRFANQPSLAFPWSRTL
jgi:hypothetical protein